MPMRHLTGVLLACPCSPCTASPSDGRRSLRFQTVREFCDCPERVHQRMVAPVIPRRPAWPRPPSPGRSPEVPDTDLNRFRAPVGRPLLVDGARDGWERRIEASANYSRGGAAGALTLAVRVWVCLCACVCPCVWLSGELGICWERRRLLCRFGDVSDEARATSVGWMALCTHWCRQ